eukprot:NODE_19123_length_859_cov_3.039617.p4 GENE.NODE_19123_length_859_cov_3.039617~~NODE_19123_length_859_cov_3.039617.p4  ORF type:complete len:91 (-),score=29.26 NODE_19123_length_859_cov_3.039617:145-417(-)
MVVLNAALHPATLKVDGIERTGGPRPQHTEARKRGEEVARRKKGDGSARRRRRSREIASSSTVADTGPTSVRFDLAKKKKKKKKKKKLHE